MVGVAVADDDVLDPLRVDAERPEVVHQHAARQPDVEQRRRLVSALARRHEQADPVLRLRGDAALVKVLNQPGPNAVTAVPEVQVRQEHVDPVLDQHGDLDAVGLEVGHQKIANGLIGEPTAPVIGSGGAVKKNS